MQLGTCVTDTGRRNPAVTAQAAATLHLMTRGRAILGIGTGERVGNEPYGVDWSKPVARFEEALATIRALWNSNGQLVNRDSEWFPLRDAIFTLPPVKGRWPQIWIASHGPRMLRATGRYADGWFPVSFFSPERYAEGLQQVQAAADNANRDPHSIIAANTQFVTGRSSAKSKKPWTRCRSGLSRSTFRHGRGPSTAPSTPSVRASSAFRTFCRKRSMNRPRWHMPARRQNPPASNMLSLERPTRSSTG
jgi:alkanesulfonate monooxygenase SsuD/methylene tetrahydromethanopterin reductase-like flavin-dependent oxidoreductase (luciferase family)